MANVSLPVYVRILLSTCASSVNQAEIPVECQVSYWLVRIVPPILIIMGNIGNMLNLVVLSRPKMNKQPTTIFLRFLACSDTITIWTGMVPTMIFHGWAIDTRNLSGFTCTAQEFINYTFAMYSIWLLVTIGIERMARTKFPVSSKLVLTRRNTAIICTILLIMSASLCFHLLFGKTFQRVEQISHSNETEVKSMCTFVSSTYLHFYQTEWPSIVLAVLAIAPPVAVLCSNAVTIWTIYMQRQRIRPTGNIATSNANTVRDSRTNAFIRMTVLLSLYYIATALPYHIFVYYIQGLPDDTADSELPIFFLVFMIVYYVAASNFSVNFFFYFGSGPMFKRELRAFWKEVSSGLRRMLRGEQEVENESRTEPIPTVSTNLARKNDQGGRADHDQTDEQPVEKNTQSRANADDHMQTISPTRNDDKTGGIQVEASSFGGDRETITTMASEECGGSHVKRSPAIN